MSNTPGPVRLTGPLAALATLLVALFAVPMASAAPTVDTPPTPEATAEPSASVVALAQRRGDDPPPNDDQRKRRRDDRGKRKPAGDGTSCTLRVPNAPLTEAGLATPYQLNGDGCHEANADTAAFVEATIVDPATNAVSVYRPLVIDDGTMPAAAPTPVTLPPGAVVGVWFGFQGDTLKLIGPGRGGCVNGLKGSPFGQFAYCNAPAFFRAAAAVAAPPLGMGSDGLPCPTTRDFSVVDQDPSDNVATRYVLTAAGTTAQDTPANQALGTVIVNGSDEGLLARKIDPALGCQPFKAPDLTQGGAPVPALALNELSAAQNQAAPVALVPPNDPMVQVGGQTSIAKTALYRAGVGQPLTVAPDAAQTYCTNLATIQPQRLNTDKAQFTASTSPDPAMNLFDFMTDRLTASLQLLGCP